MLARLLNRLDHTSSLEMLKEVCLGEIEYLGGLDDGRCLVQDIASTSHIIGLKGKEASVLHADVGHRLGVLLRHRAIESFVEELFYTLIRAHAPFKAHEGHGGFDMTWSNLISEGFVEHARFWNLLLFFFKHRMLDHQLDQIANVLRVDAGSATLKLCSYKRWISQCLVDEVDV